MPDDIQKEAKIMRACMLAYTFYETDNRVRRYAETLVKRGDTVDAIVLRRDGQSDSEIISGVHVYRIQRRVRDETSPLSYLFKLLTFFLRSAWILTIRHLKAPYDIIHVHSVPDFQVFASLIPRLVGAKVILDIHDIVPELYASKFRISQSSLVFKLLVLVERLSVRFSNHVIIANRVWHERLVKRSAPCSEHCTTILNYPDPAVFHVRPRTVPPRDEFVIAYPGTLSWHQGVDLVIMAMARLKREGIRIRFLVLGDGAERDNLTSLADELGLSDQVEIRGGVPLEQVAAVMANVDLGVEPKRKRSFANEALSTKILEFMAVGVPVLAAGTLTHCLYFQDGLIQFFESENVGDFASKILDLIDSPAKRTSLTTHGLEFIQHNNWEVKKHEYLDLVDRLREKPHRNPDSARLSRTV